MEKNVLGGLVREARKRARLSQAKLSGMAGIQRCQVSDIERGKLDLDHVHFGTVVRLSHALKLTPNDFAGITD